MGQFVSVNSDIGQSIRADSAKKNSRVRAPSAKCDVSNDVRTTFPNLSARPLHGLERPVRPEALPPGGFREPLDEATVK